MPENFAQIFEENFLKRLGERNSSEEKFNEISSKFMRMKSPLPQVNADSPIQGIPAPQHQSSVSSRIPLKSEDQNTINKKNQRRGF
jgi:hypothetical protein